MEEIVKIEKLDHFGRGIVRLNNMPVFVSNALPNEEVQIEITSKKKNFMEAKAIKYISKDKNRIEPVCPFYNICGGCDLLHLNYENQLIFKENKVKEIMKKFVDFDNVNKIIETNQFYYRNKVTLKVKEKLGYYKKKSYEIINIDKCFLVNPIINNMIKRLNSVDLTNIDEIVIKCSSIETMMVLYTTGPISNIVDKFSDLDSIINNKKVIHGKNNILEQIDGYKFVISADSFFQVNPDGMIKLYNKAIEYAKINSNDLVLDIYCGTGTIGIWASKNAKTVLGIEINEDAIKDANTNKELNNINNIDFKLGDVKEVLNHTNFKPSIIFVDPPRSGLDNKTIEHLLKLNPKKIIYISCDPVTLARDLKLLLVTYDIIEITPVDMFPNTSHIECVCSLNRR